MINLCLNIVLKEHIPIFIYQVHTANHFHIIAGYTPLMLVNRYELLFPPIYLQLGEEKEARRRKEKEKVLHSGAPIRRMVGYIFQMESSICVHIGTVQKTM